MQSQESHWDTHKHQPAQRTEVVNLIRSMLENELMTPENPHKPIVNLGLGEPTKANGYELPEEITNSVIDILKEGLHNSYTLSSGNPEAKVAVAKR
jgi:aspartate/methionine/tyrosine aminotransferase